MSTYKLLKAFFQERWVLGPRLSQGGEVLSYNVSSSEQSGNNLMKVAGGDV